jgi:Zn-dependent peptidase ImmA (M78 family)
VDTGRDGRFRQRPFYTDGELETECESIGAQLLKTRHGVVRYPLSTDDLTVLIEAEADELDLYADLRSDDGVVEGVTEFRAGRKPRVLINKRLSESNRFINRLRTTLAHEWGHVHFHSLLHNGAQSPNSLLFEGMAPQAANPVCKRVESVPAVSDWMEWQAWYAAGAVLMPKNAVNSLVGDVQAAKKDAPQQLVTRISTQFQVSRDAARVRLTRLGFFDSDHSIRDLT